MEKHKVKVKWQGIKVECQKRQSSEQNSEIVVDNDAKIQTVSKGLESLHHYLSRLKGTSSLINVKDTPSHDTHNDPYLFSGE